MAVCSEVVKRSWQIRTYTVFKKSKNIAQDYEAGERKKTGKKIKGRNSRLDKTRRPETGFYGNEGSGIKKLQGILIITIEKRLKRMKSEKINYLGRCEGFDVKIVPDARKTGFENLK